MKGQWYYSRGDVTHGPFSGQEIKEQAARKLLSENDWVWEGTPEPIDALPAQAVVDFSNLSPVITAIPNWLEDVAMMATEGPLPEPVQSNEPPVWLDDMRLWYSMEPGIAEKTPKKNH